MIAFSQSATLARRGRRALAAGLLSGMLYAAGATAGPMASFHGFRELVGDSMESRAVGVSGDGSSVLFSSDLGGYLWGSGTLTPLTFSPYAISNDGSIIVGNAGGRAVRWDSGTLSDVGTLPGASGSSAAGVSADGSVIVGESGVEAFRWVDGVMTGLGTLPGGLGLSAATAVSGDGRVVVGINLTPVGGDAFRWENGVMTRLPGLPDGDELAVAQAASGDGSVIVGVGYGETGYVGEAVRWVDEAIAILGPYPSDRITSSAWEVSADGKVIVGQYYVPVPVGHSAFIWDELRGPRDLEALLVGLGADVTGWHLTRATGLSDDHRTIVGWGVNGDGETEAWVATIPEPGAGVLLVLVGVVGVRWRRTDR